ncbi:MAG: GNAT family N-acetyltransferase [Alphaproteobacteria bacterium]|nr:GNAT family N-acetyltransferase [Alphaproteobacteria bacterium]
MTSSALVVRPAEGADLDAIIALDAAITGHSRRGFYTKRFAAAASRPQGFPTLVAVIDGAIRGFVSAHVIDGEFGGTAPAGVIDAIGISPEARGGKLARRLLEALEERFREAQVAEIQSEADWGERDLVQFFGACGFSLAPVVVLECRIGAER